MSPLQAPVHPRILRLTLAATLLAAAAACQNSDHPQPPAAAGAPTQAAGAPAQAAAATPGASSSGGSAVPGAPARPRVNVCTLLSPAEVSAIMGRELIQEPGSCDYEMDPKKKEQQFAAAQGNFQAMASQAAAGGGGGAMGAMGGMGGFGGKPKKGRHGAGSPTGTAPSPPGMPSAIMDQMKVSVEAARDHQTEDQIKDIYMRTGNIVRGALAPDQHGLHGFIQGLDEIPRLGDWAFATNVASVNMGMGFSIRGRLLEARSGPWHLTVSATVSPDPGVPALDAQLTQVARALIAKLQ